jgi:hypothetical protein
LKLSQVKKIVNFLRENQNNKHNAREIAEQIIKQYPEDYEDKKNNPRFKDEKSFISQIVAEIGSQKDQLIKQDANIQWQDKPRLRMYWYEANDKLNKKLKLKLSQMSNFLQNMIYTQN